MFKNWKLENPKKKCLHFVFIFWQVAKFWQIKTAGVEWTRAMGHY
jgi:hypothetical protein